MTVRRNWLGRLRFREFCGCLCVLALVWFFSTIAEPDARETVEEDSPPPFGVNLWGYIRGEFGVAEASRLTAFALIAVKTPLALNDLHFILRGSENHRHTDTSLEKFSISNSPRAPNFFNIIHLNANMQNLLYDKVGPRYYRNRYNIGVWYWELESLPESQHRAFWYIDEVWAVTNFMADAFRKVAAVPVQMLPCPVAVLRPHKAYTREYFKLQDSDFVFLFSFDFASFPARKNPWAVINAFQAAFPTPTSAVLFVKSTNSQQKDIDKRVFAEMQAQSMDSRIIFLDKHLSTDEVAGLFTLIDVYVSLHRSEGLGLGMLQALELGKIVIATNYSGNADFTNEDTAYVVPYRIVPLLEDYGPYKRGNVWAEADYIAASRWMKHVYENQHEAREKAKKAKAWIDQRYSASATGTSMRNRLQRIWDDRATLLRYLSEKQRNIGFIRESAFSRELTEQDQRVRREQLLGLIWACGFSLDRGHYLEFNPDVARSLVEPSTHWLNSGLREGRTYRLVKESEPRYAMPELCNRLLAHPDQF